MAGTAIALQRLTQQRLTGSPLASPGEIVAWLGAVQAQDYAGAKWSLGLRMRRARPGDAGNAATVDAIEQAFNAGEILRTHVMRPTWHFVTPADIRWMLALTAPRVHAASAFMLRQVGLDEAQLNRSNAVIAQALQGGQHLTRAELGAALAQAGILAQGIRLVYILMRGELDGVMCSGPRRGKQFTYALLEERAPRGRVFERDEALAELTRRYFTGHGPATVQDFAWWSGLTVADAKAGLEMAASHLAHEAIDGQTYWFPACMPQAAEGSQMAFLLPTYDEFLVGFASFDAARRAGRGASLAYNATILIGGQVAGSWRRTFKKGTVVIDIAPFSPLSPLEQEAVAAAARSFAEFHQMPVEFR